VARLDVNFVNRPGYAIRRRKLPLLQASFDVDVLALFIRHGDVRNFVVKNKAVPVGVGLRLAIVPGEMIRLAETGIRYLRA
jgi:hypothetical protein